MSWFKLVITGVHRDEIPLLTDTLEEEGAQSVTFLDNADEPLFEPEVQTTPLWGQTKVDALYDDMGLRDKAKEGVVARYPNAQVECSVLEDKVWVREWLKDFKPLCFGKRLWVCPTGVGIPDKDAVNILLDPGLAFGTGTHQTTSLCMSFLDGFDLDGKTVCDYGAGSGILAISAIKLGASKAYATDIDPQSIVAIKENMKRNGIDENQLTAAHVDDISIPTVDLLMANILAPPLVSLAPVFKSLVKPGGHIILSGLIESQLNMVHQAYEQDFQLLDVKSKDEWQLLVMRLNP